MSAEQLKRSQINELANECPQGMTAAERDAWCSGYLQGKESRAPAQQGGEVGKVVAWSRKRHGYIETTSSQVEVDKWRLYGFTVRPLVYGDAVQTDLATEVARLAAENDKLRENERRLIELTYKAAPVQPVGAVDGISGNLMERLMLHAEDKRNTAFARSTMNELLQVLRSQSAAAPTPPAADGVNLKDMIGGWLSSGGLVHPDLLKLVNSEQSTPPAAEPVAWCVENQNSEGPSVLIYGDAAQLKPGDNLFLHPPASPADARVWELAQKVMELQALLDMCTPGEPGEQTASPADAVDAGRWKIDLPKLSCVLDGLASDVQGNCVACRVCIGVLDGKEVQLLVTSEEDDFSGDTGFVCVQLNAAMAQGASK